MSLEGLDGEWLFRFCLRVGILFEEVIERF